MERSAPKWEPKTAMVNMEAGLVVCDEAHDARQAVSALETLQPDLVLLDMSLSCNGGLEMFNLPTHLP